MRAVISSLSLLIVFIATLAALEPPRALVAEITSDNFQTREAAQIALLEWAKAGGREERLRLYRLSIDSDDPEVRKRSGVILRELSDSDYLTTGRGFLGIRMQDEQGKVEGDPEVRGMVRIVGVVQGSPAFRAGLKVGDLLVGIDGQIWRQEAPTGALQKLISSKKPLDEVVLSVKKADGGLADIKLALAKNPSQDPDNIEGNLHLLDEKARDEHFRKWIKGKRL